MSRLFDKVKAKNAALLQGSQAVTGIESKSKKSRQPRPIKRLEDVHIGGVRTPLSVR